MANWIAGAIKRPGALTRKATAAGQSPMGFARAHASASGLTGQQSRLAETLAGLRSHMPKGGKLKGNWGDIGELRGKEAEAAGGFKAGSVMKSSRYL